MPGLANSQIARFSAANRVDLLGREVNLPDLADA